MTCYNRHSLDGTRVLVVDDSEAITGLIHDALSGWGAQVECCTSGLAAMQLLRRKAYDALVLDLVMPCVDGWQVIGFLERYRPGMLSRTILLTGDRHNTERAGDEGLGVTLMHKPFDVQQLRQTVRQMATGSPDPQVQLSMAFCTGGQIEPPSSSRSGRRLFSSI